MKHTTPIKPHVSRWALVAMVAPWVLLVIYATPGKVLAFAAFFLLSILTTGGAIVWAARKSHANAEAMNAEGKETR